MAYNGSELNCLECIISSKLDNLIPLGKSLVTTTITSDNVIGNSDFVWAVDFCFGDATIITLEPEGPVHREDLNGLLGDISFSN